MDSVKNQSEDDKADKARGYQKIRRRSTSVTPSGNVSVIDSGNGSLDSNKNILAERGVGEQRGSMDHLAQGSGNNVLFRKTTAEIISEARTLLLGTSNSGVRLVSTRRPITPKEPRRQLYGRAAAPPGRPPSAFSLRYLQSDARNLPSLEPIQIPTIDKDQTQSSRSQSVGPRLDAFDPKSQRKLPALPSTVRVASIPDNDQSRDLGNSRNSRKRVGSRTNSKESDELPSFSTVEDENQNISSSGINILSSRKLFTRNYDLLAQSSTVTLTEMLKQHSGIKECTEETVQHINAILLELYSRIKTIHGSCRCEVLGGLYGLVECVSPKILLAVARVILGLRVTGSNLTGACKLIFKVARNEANDHLFHETDVPELLIDGLGRASPLDEPEACIYGYGAVRFLNSAGQRHKEPGMLDYNRNDKFWEANSDLPTKPSTAPPRDTSMTKNAFQKSRQSSLKQISIAQRLSKHGAIQLMVLHLQMLNEAGATKKLSGPPLHSLYQLSAALRALAGGQQNVEANNQRAQSAKARTSFENAIAESPPEKDHIHLELACPHLIKAAEISIGELEIQANIIRTLSVLSEDSKCCEALSEFTGKIGMLLGPCHQISRDSPEKLLSVMSRLGYILGNIMARYDETRLQFFHNDVAMEYLFDALKFYSKQKLTLQNQMGDTVVDVLIKLVRVLANMSVNAEVGNELGWKPELGATLLHIISCTNQRTVTNLNCEVQELLNATLGALHNLCFYQDQPQSIHHGIQGSINSVLLQLAAILCQTLRSSQDMARIETARVLGNLTRNPQAREAFCRAGGLRIIVQCFGSPEYDLRTSAIGVLVNLLGDQENRAPFIELKGHLIIGEMLRRFLSQEDWLVAAIICQAFWNLLIDTNDIMSLLSEEQADALSDILAEYLDENMLFRGTNPDPMWEQFALVATDLLERLQSCLSSPQHSLRFENSSSDEDDVHIEELSEDKFG